MLFGHERRNYAMRREEFSIEDNELVIGLEYKIIEFTSVFYGYMIENSLGMSHPIPLGKRLKSSSGRCIEIQEDRPIRTAILEFDE